MWQKLPFPAFVNSAGELPLICIQASLEMYYLHTRTEGMDPYLEFTATQLLGCHL